MTYAADFTNGSKTRSATLTFYTIANGCRTFCGQQSVADKREARKVAKSLGYTPWNF